MLFPVLALAVGICCQWYMPQPQWVLLITSIAGVLLLIGISFWPDTLRIRSTPFTLLGSGLLFFSAGSGLCIKQDIRQDPQWLGAAPTADSSAVWEYIICEEPIEKPRTYSVVAAIRKRYEHHSELNIKGKIQLYLLRDSQGSIPAWGDTIWATRIPTLIETPKNPGERNWKEYQLRKGITHQLFLRKEEFQLAAMQHTFSWEKNLYALRKKICTLLQTTIPDPEAAGLAEALLIGYRQDLDPALNRSYSNTGVVHIIAISGMHLALIGGILSWCLRPFSKKRWIQVLSQFLILGSLWLFSLLAGGTPSLLRATLLFSSVALGELVQRKGNSLNTLLVSAFLLLCYDPYWLWDLGFQLSFAAIGGILLIGNKLSRQLSFRTIWWHAPGQLIAVSIAAQVFTTPLSLYYFHQFPGAFLLSNLIAVPLSSIILASLLLLLVCSPLPILTGWIGKGIAFLIMLLNEYVSWVENIPGLLFTDLQWSLPETILLLGFFIAGTHWLVNKSSTGRILTLLTGLFLLGSQIAHRYEQSRQKWLIVYQIPGITAIDLIEGNRCTGLVDCKQNKDPMRAAYIIRPSRQAAGIQKISSLSYTPQIQYGNLKIWIADKERIPPAPDSTPIDLLIIGHRAPYQGESWLLNRKIRKAVLDGSVGERTRQRWLSLLDSFQISIHDTKRIGAFVSSLR
jgi:competence protein ComEC